MWRWERITNNACERACASESECVIYYYCSCFFIQHSTKRSKAKGERNNVIIVLWSATSLFRIGIVLSPISSLLMQCNLNNSKLSGSRVRVSLSISFFLLLSLLACVCPCNHVYVWASERACDHTNCIISSARLGFFPLDYFRMHCLH